ncbi:MAG: PBP1A family penicillin-binding protein [Alphaproteobacteria bacterium]|nr:PBP1A family penicillin-binding protein [Alphaproteobacteria bacterium]MDE2500558.1 PBP1A family penicillin-binding protein [Alphaproteobacteria bacterium]
METLARAAEALGEWIVDHRRGLTKIGAVLAVLIGGPILALYMLPYALSPFAPTLNLNQDLYTLNRPVAFTFLDATGDVVGRRGAIVGERLKLDQMPPYLPAAFIAMEDRRFYSNQGIDPWGILRALIADMRARHWVAGGSTITQQTAKILFTNSARNVSRKLTDMLDAVALNKALSKQQILELYLNRLYLGSGAYGVDGASRVYFGKSARDLSLAQAAMLATLTRAPSAFSPRRDLARAQERADMVLDAMVDTGAITQEQADDAKAHPAVITDRTRQDARNFFLDTAADDAQKLIGDKYTGDMIVHTTMEPRIQDAAHLDAVKVIEGKQGRRDRAHQAAVVVMKLDGAVSAMLGGVDYDESTYNRATQAHRQPGSAFKPFVYLAALEAGLTPWDERTDGPIDINGWQPTNYGGRDYGTVTLADALAHSINRVTAEVAQEVGIPAVIEAAQRCGITSPLAPNASLALGTSDVTPLELTSAYGAFASGGYKIAPYLVTEVDDDAGHVLYKRQAPEERRIIADHVDRDLTEMMYDVVTEGTGRGAALWGREAAGKTGTTQDYHDAWFVGFTTDYVTGVWVGNDEATPMRGVTGGSLPAEIWHLVMTTAEKGLPAKPLDRSPEGVPVDQTLTSGLPLGSGDEESNGLAADGQPQQQQQPPQSSGQHSSFWDWLFGSDQKKPPQNPAPPPPNNDSSDQN